MINKEELKVLKYLVKEKEGAVWIFALFNDEKTKNDVLEKERELDAEIREFEITDKKNDPMKFIKEIENTEKKEKVIVNFFELKNGFPKLFSNLDFQREMYVDYPFVLIFWIREFEYREVMKNAPNFFSRRDAVLDFKKEIKPAAGPETLRKEGVNFTSKKDRKRKMEIYQDLAENLKDDKEKKKELALIYSSIGDLYYPVGDYDRALENYKKALKIDKELGDKSGTATSLNNIGLIYKARGDYGNALKNYEKALEIDKELGDKSGTATGHTNIAVIYFEKEEYKNALKYFEKAHTIFKEIGHAHEKIVMNWIVRTEKKLTEKL